MLQKCYTTKRNVATLFNMSATTKEILQHFSACLHFGQHHNSKQSAASAAAALPMVQHSACVKFDRIGSNSSNLIWIALWLKTGWKLWSVGNCDYCIWRQIPWLCVMAREPPATRNNSCTPPKLQSAALTSSLSCWRYSTFSIPCIYPTLDILTE